jgi:hypothetical protein
MAKKTKVQEYAESVQAQHAQSLDARDEMAQELTNHMMQMPGMAEMFSDEEDRVMFGRQLATFFESAFRSQVENKRQREQVAEQVAEEERRLVAAEAEQNSK